MKNSKTIIKEKPTNTKSVVVAIDQQQGNAKKTSKKPLQDIEKVLQNNLSISEFVKNTIKIQTQQIVITKELQAIFKNIKNVKELHNSNLTQDQKELYCLYKNKLMFDLKTIQKEFKNNLKDILIGILNKSINLTTYKIVNLKIDDNQKDQILNLLKSITNLTTLNLSIDKIKICLNGAYKFGHNRVKKQKQTTTKKVSNIKVTTSKSNNLKNIK